MDTHLTVVCDALWSSDLQPVLSREASFSLVLLVDRLQTGHRFHLEQHDKRAGNRDSLTVQVMLKVHSNCHISRVALSTNSSF